MGHLKNELCWMKPDWVAMCPEAEHLLSPGPVLCPEPAWDIPGWVWVYEQGCPWARVVGRGPGRGTYLHGHVLVDVGFAVGWEHLEQLWDQVGGSA